jgi:hypothetical protein
LTHPLLNVVVRIAARACCVKRRPHPAGSVERPRIVQVRGWCTSLLGWGLLLTATAEAATYYVATTGSDGNTCAIAATAAIDSTRAKRTVNAGVNCLAGGDTLIIRPGTYPERIGNTIPSGTSWSNPTTVRGEPSRQAILMPGPYPGNLRSVINLINGVHHIVIDGLVLDAENACCNANGYTGAPLYIGGFNDGVPVAHVRVQNSILRNARETVCIYTGDGSSDIALLNSEVSGCDPGSDPRHQVLGAHGIYLFCST